MMKDLSIDHSPSSEDREAVFGWLREYNNEQNGEFMALLSSGAGEELLLVARTSEGGPLGGLKAEILLDWLKISVMAVAPESRRSGVGTALLREAERIAIDRGCKSAYVDTMDYQGPEFYTANTYLEVGRLRNWDSHGHDKVFFTKRLIPTPRMIW